MGDLFAGERVMIVVSELDVIDLETCAPCRPFRRSRRYLSCTG
jgi:hypothetical protein